MASCLQVIFNDAVESSSLVLVPVYTILYLFRRVSEKVIGLSDFASASRVKRLKRFEYPCYAIHYLEVRTKMMKTYHRSEPRILKEEPLNHSTLVIWICKRKLVICIVMLHQV